MSSSTEQFRSLDNERQSLHVFGSVTGRMSSKGEHIMECSKPRVGTSKPKTRAQMLAMIKSLEQTIESMRRAFQLETANLRLRHANELRTIFDRQNRELLEILSNGSKEGSFPRRSS